MSRRLACLLLGAVTLFAAAGVGCPAQSGPDREALKQELRRELKEELRRELRAELAQELAHMTGQRLPEGEVRSPQPAGRVAADPADSDPPGARAARELQGGDAAPTGTPEAPPAAGGVDPETGVKVTRAVMARAVEDRTAIDVGTDFPADGSRVYAYVEVDNRQGPEVHLHFVWRLGERVYSRARLRVGRSPSWRTWSYHRIGQRQAGDWTVEIRTEQGTLLHTLAFSAGS